MRIISLQLCRHSSLPASLMQLVDSLHPFLERENWAVKSTINNALKPKSLALEKLSGVITEADESRRPLLSKGNWAAQGTITNNVKTTVIGIQPKPQLPVINTNTEIITYPSRRIYTGKDNNIVVYLPNAETKKYTIKFFDENENLVFELNKITEPYLTIERVNFLHAGWFNFEVYENGKLIEKNKFQIAKEGKN